MATSLRLPATRIGAGLWSAASQCENESLFSALERPGSHCVPTAQSRVSADLVESEVVKRMPFVSACRYQRHQPRRDFQSRTKSGCGYRCLSHLRQPQPHPDLAQDLR